MIGNITRKTVFFVSSCALAALGLALTCWHFWQGTQETVKPPLTFSYCERARFEEKSYIICRAHPARDDIRLFLHNEAGEAYKRFAPLDAMLAKKGERLAFAMNAGMYHANYNAVGLYVEGGQEHHAISTREGPGNFHLLPNGVFYIEDGKAGILDTQSYLAANIKPQFATQSGPMLVINNQIHPRFIPNSPYLQYRNGVGITQEGEVLFVISETKVNFDEMARFFRDQLATPQALFLDGSISSLYAPELGRADWWYPLGPIVGVVIKIADESTPPQP